MNDSTISIRTTRASDCIITVIGAAGGTLALIVTTVSSDSELTDFSGMRAEAILTLITSLVGAGGFRFLLALFSFWLVMIGLGAIWRLLDQRPAMVADTHGVTFHPSLHGATVSWERVERIGIAGSRPAHIEIVLKRRFWSPRAPFTARTVKINLTEARLSYRDAVRLVGMVRRLHRSEKRRMTDLRGR